MTIFYVIQVYLYKIFYFYMFLTILFLCNYIILKFEYYLLECQCWASNLRIIMVQSRQNFSKNFKFYLAKESNTNNRLCFLFPSSFIITILCIGKVSKIKKFFCTINILHRYNFPHYKWSKFCKYYIFWICIKNIKF